MIDLLATRKGPSEQTIACGRLLTAVIAKAIKDACAPLTIEEKRFRMNLNPYARDALWFLFSPCSAFAGYCRLLGITAESVRGALLREPAPGAKPEALPQSVAAIVDAEDDDDEGGSNRRAKPKKNPLAEENRSAFPPEKRPALRQRLEWMNVCELASAKANPYLDTDETDEEVTA